MSHFIFLRLLLWLFGGPAIQRFLDRMRNFAATKDPSAQPRPGTRLTTKSDVLTSKYTKIFLLGCTGNVGKELVRQLIMEDSKQVTLVTRNRASSAQLFQYPSSNLNIVEGDVTNPNFLSTAMKGHDAVICLVGSAVALEVSIYTDVAKALTKAMESASVKRLIFATSAGVRRGAAKTVIYDGIVKPLVLQPIYNDMTKAEEILMKAGSRLDWTILALVGLFEGERTNKIRYRVDEPSTDGFWLSLSDTAVAVRKILATNDWIHRVIQPAL